MIILSWVSLPGVHAKTTWHTLELANDTHSAIRAYVSEPDNATGKLPTILILHGGQGLMREHVNVANEFAAKGFIAVAICLWDPRTSASPPPPNARVEIIPCDDAPKLLKPPLADVYRSKTLGTLRATRKFYWVTRELILTTFMFGAKALELHWR